MKNVLFLIFLPFFSNGQFSPNFKKLSEVKSITKNFTTFWNYYNEEINLSEEYIPMDQSMSIINKNDFLRKLATGSYLPLRAELNKTVYYKLFELDGLIDNEIHNQLLSIGGSHYKYYQMEGTQLPSINSMDLAGKNYNIGNKKDKVLVIKCWFINCKKCIEEIPYLNTLFDKYKKRSDIDFVSLAIDNENDLNNFLKKIKFNYSTIPNQQYYMEKILKVEAYPTHIIVDKNNTIIKVLNDAKNIKPVLDKLFL